ncbi:MAG: hypothetical protein JXA25_07630 [Anaerolineales bacterium]|nr:hypothetical protein [Anaerolineales bacterium]
MIQVKRRILILITFLIVSAFLILGYLVGNRFPLAAISNNYPLVKEARMMLEQYSYYPFPVDIELERGMIRGFTEAIGDPFTMYMDPVEHELQEANLAGEYGGIGVSLQVDGSEQRIRLYPYSGSPAALAGVIEGDFLLQVDAAPITSELSLDEVTALLHGPIPSTVVVKIEEASPPYHRRDLVIQREMFSIPSVQSYLHPEYIHIGVIRITMFSDKTGDELESALLDVLDRGAEDLILDLRGNNGGILTSAVDAAGKFLIEGVIVREIRKHGDEKVYSVDEQGDYSDVPLVVLVDQGTASAAEVVAAALQDHRRAVIIGRRTYGKGSVQVVVTLSDDSSLNITNAIWQTPAGRSINGYGITPDIEIPLDNSNELDEDIEAAIEWLQQ